MRIAVISDIHGNLPALKAVLQDLEVRQTDHVICLGDLVDFAPWTNEVIELIRSQRIMTIMGNYDERIAYDLSVIDKPEQSVEETMTAILDSGIPDFYADALIKAKHPFG